ncbi:hypothetical protein BD309DRAFT_1028639 [Dichomitus squalens]|nr:hypothetical protein BD309DRAFT_1028639 [Dichomitus squalens]
MPNVCSKEGGRVSTGDLESTVQPDDERHHNRIRDSDVQHEDLSEKDMVSRKLRSLFAVEKIMGGRVRRITGGCRVRLLSMVSLVSVGAILGGCSEEDCWSESSTNESLWDTRGEAEDPTKCVAVCQRAGISDLGNGTGVTRCHARVWIEGRARPTRRQPVTLVTGYAPLKRPKL